MESKAAFCRRVNELMFMRQGKWTQHQARLLNVTWTDGLPAEAMMNRLWFPEHGDEVVEQDILSDPGHVQLRRSCMAFLRRIDPKLLGSSAEAQQACNRLSLNILMRSLIRQKEIEALRVCDPLILQFEFNKVISQIQADGGIFRKVARGGTPEDPVVLISTPQEEKCHDVLPSELPLFLVQAVVAFQRNPDFINHTAYVIRMSGTSVQLASANISVASLERMQQGDTTHQKMEIRQSVWYNTLIPDQQRKLIRLFLALLNQLDACVQIQSSTAKK
ncbi:uncharacterized protein CIMG_06330 [Coccidioides immitis RS]|uniref:Uncharacterized protein n=1 Tax=Coccidioides immitis (strain RS) TaxID=246410 RepID=J3K7X7_COCIM|nr:uncharacterized protein CIMG_06330 [Coccidioides immitis RS]EAS30851.3 hypothetical protein CIMG_06330 [Coccidioides immitis RS]TPX23734.1 hypothetical protein DIZ76_013073 [Coccidioides immitis]